MNSNAGKPVLLLIPGMLNTARIWGRVAPLLQDFADIRIADVTTQSSIADMARDAWALVADVPATQRLAVCGFSMGGYVALELIASNLIAISAHSNWTSGLIHTSSRPETADGKLAREKTIAAIERDFERVIQSITAQHIIMRPRAHEIRLFVPRRLVELQDKVLVLLFVVLTHSQVTISLYLLWMVFLLITQ